MIDKQIALTPDYSACRIINGGWQLSEGHKLQGTLDFDPVLQAFHQLADRGFNTFDCADIYTGSTDELLEYEGKKVSKQSVIALAKLAGLNVAE